MNCPRELRRLIEFLNEQFTKIEVLGVELRQYVGQGIKALVPRVQDGSASVIACYASCGSLGKGSQG